MIKSVEDFLEAWRFESESTKKVFDDITDESLKQKVTSEGRSLGFLAWHITQTIGEMMSKTGLDFPGFDEHAPAPTSIKLIKTEYEKLSDEMVNQVQKNWKDEMLQDDVNMYGSMWKRADVLASLTAHQSHHRGQMTVLMRQAGLKVPGIYGPSKEEWAALGIPPME
jgi:uncharacterized damage-inducible protein DinB